MNVSNSTGVESSNSVRRPQSKDTKSKNKVLKNTNAKSSSAHVRKVSSSVSIDSNKHETMNSTVCQSNASVLNTKTVNAVKDGSNIVCVSLCNPTNDCDDLRKMKPKADIGILVGYSESSRGPGLNSLNFQDSSDQMNEIPSHQDLDNLFGPLYEEYYAPSTSKVSNNSATNTLDVKDTPSPSSIIVEDSDAMQIVTSSEEPITQESLTPVLETHSDEQIQKDVAKLDGNTIMHSFENPEFEEAK
ncbi:hypothetical protein Tco_0927262 [Tanacetum coccineum]